MGSYVHVGYHYEVSLDFGLWADTASALVRSLKGRDLAGIIFTSSAA